MYFGANIEVNNILYFIFVCPLPCTCIAVTIWQMLLIFIVVYNNNIMDLNIRRIIPQNERISPEQGIIVKFCSI